MKQPHIFVPITKIDAAKRLVYGVAASEEVDKANEIFDYDSSKPNFEAWSKSFAEATDGKSLGNVRAMHGKVAAGRLEQIVFDDPGKRIEVCAKIIDDDEWAKVEEAVYTGFSIGGSYSKKWKDGDATRYTAIPSEISIVDNPCVPSALFTMVKMDGTTEQRAFANSNKEHSMITNDMVAAKAKEMAKAAGDESKWATLVDQARSALEAELSKAKKADDKEDAKDEGKDDADKADDEEADDDKPKGKKKAKKADEEDKPKDDEKDADKAAAGDLKKDAPAPNAPSPDLEQVWKAKDGKTFSKKADAVAHNEELAKSAPPEDKLTASLDALSKQLDDIEKAKKPDNEDDSADEEGDADADESDKDMEGSAKAKKKKAKKADDEEDKPKDKKDKAKKAAGPIFLKKADDAGSLSKGLYFVSIISRIIDDVDCLRSSAEWEAASEGDNSPVPAMLGDNLQSLCDTLMAMAEEETRELLSNAGVGGSVEVMEMAAAPKGKDMAALLKVAGEAFPILAKAGARHSKGDQEKIQKVHDHAIDLGAVCHKADDDKEEKAAGGDLSKALKDEQDKSARLEGSIAKALPIIDELQKRIAALEAQPKPRPRELVNTNVVDKSQDGVMNQVADLMKTHPDEFATAMIKLAQLQPRQMFDRGSK